MDAVYVGAIMVAANRPRFYVRTIMDAVYAVAIMVAASCPGPSWMLFMLGPSWWLPAVHASARQTLSAIFLKKKNVKLKYTTVE